MPKPSRRRFTPAVCALEPRRLLTTFNIQQLGQQEGIDKVRISRFTPDPPANITHEFPDDYSDYHIHLSELSGRADQISRIVLARNGGQTWSFQVGDPNSTALFAAPNASANSGDIYFQPISSAVVGPGLFFDSIRVHYNGLPFEELSGVRFEHPLVPNLRVPSRALNVTWHGQDNQDWTSPGPAVGPDGIQDVHLTLSNLSYNLGIERSLAANDAAYHASAVLVEDLTTGDKWQSGNNPNGYNNAELFLNGDPGGGAGDGSGELYFSPTSPQSLLDHHFRVTVSYSYPSMDSLSANNRTDSATITATTAASNAAPVTGPAPGVLFTELTGVTAVWAGQATSGLPTGVASGSVKIHLGGLPDGASLVRDSITLTNQSYSFWSTSPSSPSSGNLGLTFVPTPGDPTSGDLYYLTNRNEKDGGVTIRLDYHDGTSVKKIAVARVTGQTTDYNAQVDKAFVTGTATADPTSNNNIAQLVANNDTVYVKPGEYTLTSPLIINHPVKVIAIDPGTHGNPTAILRFQQAGGAAWSAAIDIQSSHVTLQGFGVSLAGLVAPAEGIIAHTGYFPARQVDMTLSGLTIDAGSLQSTQSTLIHFSDGKDSGTIINNVLRGGSTEVTDGPWTISNNDYQGVANGIFLEKAAFRILDGGHDITVSDNHAHGGPDSGVTYRFLQETGGVINAVISGNTIDGYFGTQTNEQGKLLSGERGDLPEIFETEGYQPHFEGKPASVSADGLILKIPQLRGINVGTGGVVTILSGTVIGGGLDYANTYYRIAQAIDIYTFVLERSLPGSGTYSIGSISISDSSAHVGETFDHNTVDASQHASNQTSDIAFNMNASSFDVSYTGNIVKGLHGIKVYAYTQPAFSTAGTLADSIPNSKTAPDLWTLLATVSLRVDGNVFEDASEGGDGQSVLVFSADNANTKTSSVRLFSTATITNNTFIYNHRVAPSGGETSIRYGSNLYFDKSSYRVSTSGNNAFTGTGDSAKVTELARTGNTDTPILAGPSAPNASASPGSSSGQIVVSWSAAPNATSYVVERSPDGIVGWRQVNPVNDPSSSFTDTGRQVGLTYYYRVRAFSAGPNSPTPGYSKFSQITSAIASIGIPASTPVATSLGQDGGDFVGAYAGLGADGYQDLHIRVTGLPNQAITYVDVKDPSQDEWTFGSTSHFGINVVSNPAAGTADFYLQTTTPEDGARDFTIQAIQFDGAPTLGPIVVKNVMADVALPVYAPVTRNQDGHDDRGRTFAPAGTTAFQAIHFILNGLPSYRTITSVDVLPLNAGPNQRSVPGGSISLNRVSNSNTADLYIPTAEAEADRPYQLVVHFDNGTSLDTFTSSHVYADLDLPMPGFDSLNQDGHNATGSTNASGPTDYQAVHLRIANLPSYKTIASVQILPLGGGNPNEQTVYNGSPSLVRAIGSHTADLYFVPQKAESDVAYQLVVTFTDGTGGNHTAYSDFAASHIYADLNLPMASFLTLNQDGHNATGSSNSAGPTDYQAVHLVLGGLPSYKTIASIDILPLGGDANQRTIAGGSTSLIRGAGSRTAELFVLPLVAEVANLHNWQLVVSFTDGTGGQATAYSQFPSTPVVADLNLPMPAGTSFGQDERDLTANGSNWPGGGDGYQDIHIALTGIPSGKTIGTIDIVGLGPFGGEWRYNIPGTDKAAVLRKEGSTTADLYISPFRDDVNSSVSVAITFTDGTTAGSVPFLVTGINGDRYLPMPTLLFADGFGTTTVGSAWSGINGTWSADGTILHQSNGGSVAKKLRLTTPASFPDAVQIQARVRVDSGVGGDDARVGVGLFTDGSGNGYNLVFHDNNSITLLNDGIAWGGPIAFAWTRGTWYWFKLKVVKDPASGVDTLYGKVWADGDVEPTSWPLKQTGWTRMNGSPALEGGSNGSATASFDDVSITTPPLFHDAFNVGTMSSFWTTVNGAWSQSGGMVAQTSTADADPKKLVAISPALYASGDQAILAKVRVDSWTDGYSRAGVGLHTDPTTGLGYNLVFNDKATDTNPLTRKNYLYFLNDGVRYGDPISFNWSVGTWYWFRMQLQGDTLYGKVWADGDVEPSDWMIRQTVGGPFGTRASGYPALNGGSAMSTSDPGASTATFDDVTVTGVAAASGGAVRLYAVPGPAGEFRQAETTLVGTGPRPIATRRFGARRRSIHPHGWASRRRPPHNAVRPGHAPRVISASAATRSAGEGHTLAGPSLHRRNE